ncbi:MAG: DMT family transporter, partial [Planctomycetota bacterium]
IALILLGVLLPFVGTLPHGHAFLWLLASGAVGLGIGDLAMYRGYELVGPRLIVLLTQCLAAPIAGIIEWLWLGSAPRPAQIAWICMTIVGVALALGPKALPKVDARHLRAGIYMGLLSACGLAMAGVLTRQAAHAGDGSGLLLIGLAGGIGAAFVRNLGGSVAAFTAGWMVSARSGAVPTRTISRLRGWCWLIGTAFCGPAAGVVCYQWALIQAPAATVQAVLALVPVLVMPVAWIVEGDRPSAMAWIGAVVAVAGAIGVACS